jgi:TPR repeat protein
MTKRVHAVSIGYGFSIALSALAIAAFPSIARAQSADLVLCDRLAADPTDTDKPASVKGVGEIAPGDIATAITFCKVASAKSRRALFELGRAYAANQQLPQAIAAYRQAAEKGSTAAMVELGMHFQTGAGVAQDDAQARKLFERAAAAGNPRAITALAAAGGGASSDPVRTRAMLSRAADANSAEAEYQLGLMMAGGIGGPQDDVAARALFEKAAVQDNVGALEQAGEFARDGRGGPQDRSAAKAYFERAAALGNQDAREALKKVECNLVLRDKRGGFVGCL